MKNPNNKKGFTLVELSIVLVIIGLLIGGILAAQSMIETTKIQAFTRQIGQFDAAVVNFGDKFGGLPGDTSAFSTAGAVTQNNGIIETGDNANLEGEAAQFWNQLTLSGLKREEGAGEYSAAGFPVGTAFPRAKVGAAGTGVIGVGETDGLDGLAGGPTGNAYFIGNCSGMSANNTLACEPGLTGSQAIAIDAKLDDGVSTTGNVGGNAGTGINTWAKAVDEAPVAYTAGNDATTNIVIRMGVATGVLK